MGTVNKTCKDFELKKMSIDQFKCLIFVACLSPTKHLEIRTKLLTKLENEHDKIKLEKLSDEYRRIINLKKDATMIQKPVGNDLSILVNQVSKKKNSYSKRNKPKFQTDDDNCGNCGKTHTPNECPAAKSKCSFCGFNGHWVEYCRTKKRDENKKSQSSSNENTKNKVHSSNSKPKVSSVSLHAINCQSRRKYIDIKINDKPVQLQADSATDISIISQKNCRKFNLKIQTLSSELAPKNASGELINLIGEINCNIEFKNEVKNATIFVSRNEDLNIFDDLLELFELWDKPFNEFCSNNRVFQIKTHDDYTHLLKSKFSSCFEKSLGKCNNFKAHLTLKKTIIHHSSDFVLQRSLFNH